MANRVLRDWTCSETIDQLSEFAEIFFTRLIMKADDFGRFYGSSKILKSQLFPLKDYSFKQVEKWRDEIVKSGVVKLYSVDEKEYLEIKDFNQRLRIMKSKFPEPPSNDSQMTVKCLTDDGLKRNETETETKQETKQETETFHPSEIAEQVNRIFGKELTERRIPRLDRDVINDLITVYGYTKTEVVKAWENMSRDKWHKEHQNVITLQYLGQTKTMERFSGTSKPDTPTEGMIFKRSSLNL